MASGAAGNGPQASLEDMLSTDVDESVVNALKGSLESQLCDDPSQNNTPTNEQFQAQPTPQQQQQFQTVATTTAQMSAMQNLANVASQQSPIVVQKQQIQVQLRPEGDKQPTGLQLVNVQRNLRPTTAAPRVILSQPIRMSTAPQMIRTSQQQQQQQQQQRVPSHTMMNSLQHQRVVSSAPPHTVHQQMYYSHSTPLNHGPPSHHPGQYQYYRYPIHQQYPHMPVSQHGLYERSVANYMPPPLASQWSRPSSTTSSSYVQQQAHMNRMPLRAGAMWERPQNMGIRGPGVRVGAMMGTPPMNRMLIREGPPAVMPGYGQGRREDNTITFQPGVPIRPGTLIVRHDQSGQIQLVNMGGLQQQRLTTIPVSSPTVTKRPGATQVVLHQSSQGQVVMQPGTTMATPAVRPLTVQTSHSGNVQTSGGGQNTASQMSPNTAKKKCKNFLATLIRLASDQPEQTAANVKALIQGLIDGNIPPEDFTTQLQRELNSSPQPCLVPFLKKSLPHLRQSLMTKELSIDGVRPPPPGSLTVTQNAITPQAIIRPSQATTVRLLQPRMVTVTPTPRAILSQGHMISTGMKSIVVQTPTPTKPIKDLKTINQLKTPITAIKPPVIRSVASVAAEKVRYGSALREDDDINDVAAMGGVNLQEESQRILASSELVGATRSCGDDVFLLSVALEKRIHLLATKSGLDSVDPDVVKLVSHAVQEKLKGYIEKLNIISEHRAEPPAFKAEPGKFEATSDVRTQLRFLDELDKLEKKRHEEHERELLLRVAKSRSKMEDPEQLKLKQRAKEMQKAEMEEMRQREANMTALQAIGPRKKPKMDGAAGGLGQGNNKAVLRPRIKRVNMKDVLFLLETDKAWMRSSFIYKNYLK